MDEQRARLVSPLRRAWLQRTAAAASLGWSAPVLAQAQPVVLATPGPGSSVSAIPELAARIGADAAEGLALRLKFTGGGGIAIREIYSGNAQCGVFGLSAAMNENLQGPRLVALAAVEAQVPLTLLVRADLRAQVRQVTDLRGRAVGIHSNSLSTITNSQQFLNLLLRRHGLAPDAVRQVAAGQSWEPQVAALKSGLVDAIMTEEPFGLRLEREKLAHALVRLGVPDLPLGLPGEGFLRGALITTPALVERDPVLAERLVRMLRRTLAWRRAHSATEMVAALALSGDEASAFTEMLQRYPRQFSDDGSFPAAQLAQTETFFRESMGGTEAARAYRLASMLVDRWAGRSP